MSRFYIKKYDTIGRLEKIASKLNTSIPKHLLKPLLSQFLIYLVSGSSLKFNKAHKPNNLPLSRSNLKVGAKQTGLGRILYRIRIFIMNFNSNKNHVNKTPLFYDKD